MDALMPPDYLRKINRIGEVATRRGRLSSDEVRQKNSIRAFLMMNQSFHT